MISLRWRFFFVRVKEQIYVLQRFHVTYFNVTRLKRFCFSLINKYEKQPRNNNYIQILTKENSENVFQFIKVLRTCKRMFNNKINYLKCECEKIYLTDGISLETVLAIQYFSEFPPHPWKEVKITLPAATLLFFIYN